MVGRSAEIALLDKHAAALERQATERDARTHAQFNPRLPTFWDMQELSDKQRAQASELRKEARALRRQAQT